MCSTEQPDFFFGRIKKITIFASCFGIDVKNTLGEERIVKAVLFLFCPLPKK